MRKLFAQFFSGIAILAFIHFGLLLATNGKVDVVSSIIQGFHMYFG